jgi:hypothetical protein
MMGAAMRNIFALTLVLLLSASLWSDELLKENKLQVTVEKPPTIELSKGKPGSTEVRVRVKSGFHINSSKPSSELLIPTKLTVESTPLFQVKKITYPDGSDFSFSFAPEEKLNVYSGEFTILVDVVADKKAAAGPHALKGELKYQACSDIACFPPKKIPVELAVVVK